VKTISLKKVSAVAVASLGFGLLSVVPVNAAPPSASTVFGANFNSISLKTQTSTPVVGSDVYVNVGGDFAGSAAAATTSTGSVTALRAVLSSYPAGGFVTTAPSTNVEGATAGTKTLPTGCLSQAGNAAVTGGVASGFYITLANDATTACAAGVVAASTTAGFGSFKFTPTVAGTYVMTVWNDGPAAGATTVGNGAVDAAEAQQTVSITVSATPVASAGASLIYTDSDGTYTAAPDAASTAANKIFHTKTPTTQAAGIRVTINNTSGTAVFLTGGTFVAEQSGSGLVACTDTEGTFTEGTTKTRYASLTSLANNIVACALWSDGTAGKGTTTIKWIDAAGVSTTLGTVSSVFYGAPAKIVAKQNHTIAKSTAATLGIGTAAPSGADVENTPAVTLTITDADGNLVSDIAAGTITAVTSNSSVMTSTISYAESSGAGAGDGFAGNGNYNVRVNSSTNASGSTATLTFRALGADGVTYVTSSPLTYTLGGTPASSVLTLDKTTYAVGQEAVATITVKDSAGNAVYDTDHAGYFAASTGLTSTLALVKTLYGATALSTLGGKAVTKFNAPSVAGTMTITGTALDKPSALSASATVTDGNAAIAASISALNAKIVALNALIAKIMKRLNIR
jgi:hypothetical protein